MFMTGKLASSVWYPKGVQEFQEPVESSNAPSISADGVLSRSCPTPRILSEILVSRFTSTIHRRAWRSQWANHVGVQGWFRKSRNLWLFEYIA